jgi:hypothetical protein
MCDTNVKFLYLTPYDSFLHKNVVSKWKCLSHNVKIMQKQTISHQSLKNNDKNIL